MVPIGGLFSNHPQPSAGETASLAGTGLTGCCSSIKCQEKGNAGNNIQVVVHCGILFKSHIC